MTMKKREPLPDGWTIKSIPIVKDHVSKDSQVVYSINKHLVYTFNKEGQTICGAYNSQHKTYCKMFTVKDSNRCRWHGGKSDKV